MQQTIPTLINDIRCERCAAETEATPRNDADVPTVESEEGAEESTFEIACVECAMTGMAVVSSDEIIGVTGDLFPTPTGKHDSYHHGWREETNVMLKEHYTVDADASSAPGSGDIEFTDDEIIGGWGSETTYKCSCNMTFYSKEELAEHLVVTVANDTPNSPPTR